MPRTILPRWLARKPDLRILLCAFAALLIAAVWGLTLYQLSEAKRVHAESAERDAKSLARLFEEHATRTIEAADQAVTYLRQRYNVLGPALDIKQDLESGLSPDNIYNLFSIVDEDGNMVDNDSGKLFISKPVQGRVSKKWSIQMTRRINHPDGRLKGVVIVSMDPQYFTRLYHDIDVGQKGTISLIGEDGVIRVRRIGDTDSRGQNVANTAFFPEMIANGTGTTRSVSSLDGRERIVAYAKVKDYPLYAVVGIDLEERFAAYYATRRQALTLASLISVITVMFTAGLVVVVGRLLDSRRQAIAANRAKSRFLANMSHELRTPLNGILGYSEMLQEDSDNPVHRGFAKTIYQCGTRLLGLIDSVLELSALESGKSTLTVQTEALTSLLDNAIGRHRKTAAGKQLALSVVVAPGAPDRLICDRTKLIRVLDGLLDNAVRLTESGAVELRVSPAGGELVFAVADTGPGIPAELRDQIFEKFSQADDSPTRSDGGAGLGLAIASRIVMLMGGILSMTSAPGSGTTFSFALPLKGPDAVAA
jgi:two-component system sensor histidine kinase BarA